MRIISGAKRGRRLVDWEDAGIRPMRDFVRTALFNIVSDFVPDAAFLDLYCGTGSVGLEALSRGARTCTFVDRSAEACRIVRRNLDLLDFVAKADVVTIDALQAIGELQRMGRQYDLVFIGPPYYHELVPQTLHVLGGSRLLTDDPVVVAEVHSTESVSDAYGSLGLVEVRRYGDNQLAFYRHGAANGSNEGAVE